jgi:hypothetical protein
MMEQELRERLGTVPVPPTRLQVDGLVAAGRRRVRRRRVLQAGCGAALVTGLLAGAPMLVSGRTPQQVAAPPATVRCAVAELPLPAGVQRVAVSAVDPGGRYVVASSIEENGESRSVLWTDGNPKILPRYAVAVNASGTVLAVGGDEKRWNSVVRYAGGVPTELRLPAGGWIVQPYPALNARGDVLATIFPPVGGAGETQVLLWPAGSDQATRVSLPAGAESVGLADDGTVVGTVHASTTFAWDRRGLAARPELPAEQSIWVSSVRGGQATGNLRPSGHVARWDLRTGEVTRMPFTGLARAANARGWVVVDGAIRSADATVELPTIDGAVSEAVDVADNGVVVGWLPNLGVPLRWTCAG